jgi:hypothetical protein
MAPHLTDMDELLSRIVSPAAADYMAEALKCYQGGTYRACVVVCNIALFHDLRTKLLPLASVNKAAKKLHAEIEQKVQNQEVYESLLADRLASLKLIDPIQKSRLEIITKLRNKSAHPSGVHASAEEARYVFFETIDKFLALPALQTTFLADSILVALAQGNYFPSRQLEDISAIAKNDVAALHEQGRPYLVAKLVEAQSVAGPSQQPAAFFLFGLAAMQDAGWRVLLQTTIIVGKAQSSAFGSLIIGMLRSDPELTKGLGIIDMQRIGALLEDSVKAEATTDVTRLAHPLSWLDRYIDVRGQEIAWEEFEVPIGAIIKKHQNNEALMITLASSGPIQDAYIDELVDRAMSGNFDLSKSAANALQTIDQHMGATFSSRQAFRVVAAMMVAAENGTYAARSVCDGSFKLAPQIRDRALNFADQHPDQSKKFLRELCLSTTFEEFWEILGV